LKKKSISKLNILTTLAEFIWEVSIEDFRRIYLIIVLFQFTYCVSIWYVLNEEHDFKQKKNVALIFMRNIQTRAAQIISNAFRFIVEVALNVELYLLSIRQQLNMIIYDALLRLIISSTYFFIKSLRVLLNRFLVFNQTQHQRMLYAQLSSLQKLKIKYAAVFNKDLDRFEPKISFFVIFWWKSSIIIIISSTKIAIITHDQIMQKCSHLIIFTDDIDIDNQIKTSAVTIIFSISRMISIVMNKKTSLSEIDHWDHDLLRRNNKTRSRFERDEKSSQKSSHRHLHELSNCDSSHSVFQKTVWSISASNADSKNRT
jgi:hypothetical protein